MKVEQIQNFIKLTINNIMCFYKILNIYVYFFFKHNFTCDKIEYIC